jgi:hypothetical protein
MSMLNAELWTNLPAERPEGWPPGSTWDVLVAHVRYGESYRSLGERLGTTEYNARHIAYLGRSYAVQLGFGPLPWQMRR